MGFSEALTVGPTLFPLSAEGEILASAKPAATLSLTLVEPAFHQKHFTIALIEIRVIPN